MYEIIKKAYGEHYNSFKDMMDENGWVLDENYWWMDAEDLFDIETEEKNLGYGNYVTIKWRPVLVGKLEYNNGWIKIESEDDYPRPGQYWVIDDDEDMFMTDAELFGDMFDWSSIRYYQLIVKPLPPIY